MLELCFASAKIHFKTCLSPYSSNTPPQQQTVLELSMGANHCVVPPQSQ